MSKKKINAAAMRRARQQLLEQRAESGPPLPAGFITWCRQQYRPAGELATAWPAVRPFVLAALERSTVRGEESLRKHTTHLAYFGAWLTQQGIEVDARSLTRPHVDEYCRVGMPGSSRSSRGDRRSRLRSLADQVNPDQAPVKAQSVARDPLKPPYTAAEMVAVRRAIMVQPTVEITRQLCVCVGCGAGAGIDSPDLKQLLGQHVVDAGDDGIRIDIPGRQARRVWVLRDYETILRRGISGIAAGSPLLGRNPDRKNVAARVFDNATLLGSVPRLEQSRLRTTWLAELMRRPVPLAVICQAAGLRSTRTLFDLLPFLSTDASDPATAAEALRGETR
jgi:hypothetical protein